MLRICAICNDFPEYVPDRCWYIEELSCSSRLTFIESRIDDENIESCRNLYLHTCLILNALSCSHQQNSSSITVFGSVKLAVCFHREAAMAENRSAWNSKRRTPESDQEWISLTFSSRVNMSNRTHMLSNLGIYNQILKPEDLRSSNIQPELDRTI